MNDLYHLILSTHQSLLVSLCLAFSFYLVQDLYQPDGLSIKLKRYLAAFFSIFAFGVYGLFFHEWGQEGIFFAIAFSILVTFSVIHPKYAIGFLVFLFLSRPWETYDNQMMSSVPRDISYLTIISMVGHKILKRQFYFRFNAGTFLILAFSIWVFLSAFFSQHSDEALFKYEEVFSKGIILFLLIQNCLEKDSDMLPVKTGFILAILEKCFVSFFKANLMELPTIVEDANARLESVGILSNSNDIASIFVLAIPFAVFFIIKTNLKPFNWLIALCTFIMMGLLVWQTASRGALLGIFAIFGAYILIKIKNRKYLFLAIALSLVATIASFSLMNRDSSDIEGSTSNRILYWKAGLNMAVRNPVFGVGFWGFPKNLPIYATDGNVGSEESHMTAHSSWILALAEGGFAALFLFASLWLYAGFAAWKIRLTQPEYLLGIAGYGMSITFLSHTYMLFPYILLGLVITHYQIENRLVIQKEFL